MIQRLIAALVLLLAGSASAADGYYRFPALAGDSVLFTAEGDVWSVPAAGGRAVRLTTHPSQKGHETVSPDGKLVAFSAAYDGPTEVYVMPVTGATPKRLTFDGGRDVPVGWTPSGEVLYSAQSADGPTGQRVVAAVDPVSVKRHVLPLLDVADATVTPDGKTLIFTRFGLTASGDNVRAYRGGLLSRLWRFDLAAGHEAEPVSPPDQPSNERLPMIWGNRLIVVSDRDGNDNLWSMALDGSDRHQLTHHAAFPVRTARISAGRIVYQLGADLHLFDLASSTDKVIPIELTSDFAQERPHTVKAPLNFFESAVFSPKGDRVTVTALGHVALIGIPPLRRIEISAGTEDRLRGAVPSPDGRWVYAALQTGGTTEIWRLAADGGPERKQLTQDGAGFRTHLWPSPDGKMLAHATRDGKLFLLDLVTGTNQLVDTADFADLDMLTWSADSRYLAYQRADSAASERTQLFLYEPASRTRQRLTSDRYNSFSPAFTPDGKWVYFLSDRTFQSRNPEPWGDRNLGPYFDRRTKIYALALQDGLRFPFLPKDELTPVTDGKDGKGEDKDKGKEQGKKGGTEGTPGPAVQWSGLAGRLFEVPLEGGDYERLATDGKRLYLLNHTKDPDHLALVSLAIDQKEPQLTEFLGDVADYALSADGKKVFLRRWAQKDKVGDMLIVDTGEKAPTDLAKQSIHAGDWALEVDPKRQWRQMFDDSWLMHRDFFYDAAMRGVDWGKVRDRYAPLAERVTDRDELNDVLAQMSAELGALHSQIILGNVRTAQDGGKPGFLGARLERQADGYRIAHIFRTDPELPSERAPLARPGVDAREGDVIAAVNGRPVAEVDDIASMLVNQAGNQVLLTLKRDGKEVRTIVSAIDARSNDSLRYGDWENERSARVQAAGGGRIGYVHLRAMGAADIATFAREFYAQYDRDALIIDVRRNNGGDIDSWIIEKLLRRAWAVWRPRGVKRPTTNMQQTFRGHLAVLIDERTYSDGETFAAAVKALKLGPLVGRRTSGAGVWLADDNTLTDRGRARVAEWGQYAIADGSQLIEGKGVEPDIDVENLPNATFKGSDAQLDRAIQLLQDQLKSDPVKPL
jgi:tricorn protease